MPGHHATYMCLKCDASFESTDPIRFCSKCGSPVKLVEGDLTKQVLLIDDSKLTRNKIASILKNLGFRVIEAEDGPTGLSLIETSQLDLIILDIEMPQMTGIEVLKKLKETGNTIPVIMLTGHADIEKVKQVMAAGAKDYLLKDLSVLEIGNRIKKYLQP